MPYRMFMAKGQDASCLTAIIDQDKLCTDNFYLTIECVYNDFRYVVKKSTYNTESAAVRAMKRFRNLSLKWEEL